MCFYLHIYVHLYIYMYKNNLSKVPSALLDQLRVL